MTKLEKLRLLSTVRELTLVIGLVIVFIAIGWQGQREHAWLQQCALRTHGSIEHEPTNPSAAQSGIISWHYFVRTPDGRRVEYGDRYKEDR